MKSSPDASDVSNILEVRNLTVEYGRSRADRFEAVSNVSLEVRRGETLGVVGESGCGKSTLARAISRLTPTSGGSVRFKETEILGKSEKQLRAIRSRLQIIFQDPVASLNPRRQVRDIVAEPLRLHHVKGRTQQDHPREIVVEALEHVGLDNAVVGMRRPHELSGGQCQRVCIARALVLRPELLICDEAVSALDVSVQAQVLNLLEDLKSEFGLTLVFISHDLRVIHSISDRVIVMYLGRLCEIAPVDSLFRNPRHPYTEGLLAAISASSSEFALDPQDEMPSVRRPPSGCRFRTRCTYATDRCAKEVPELVELEVGHWVACHYPLAADEVHA